MISGDRSFDSRRRHGSPPSRGDARDKIKLKRNSNPTTLKVRLDHLDEENDNDECNDLRFDKAFQLSISKTKKNT